MNVLPTFVTTHYPDHTVITFDDPEAKKIHSSRSKSSWLSATIKIGLMMVALIGTVVALMPSNASSPNFASAASMEVFVEDRTLNSRPNQVPSIVLLESGSEIVNQNSHVASMDKNGNLIISSRNQNSVEDESQEHGWDLVSSVIDDGYHSKFTAVEGSRLELRLDSEIVAVVDPNGVVVWSDVIVEVDSSYDTFELSLSPSRALQVLASKSSDATDKVVIYDFFSACAANSVGC